MLLETKCNQGSLCYVYIWLSLFHMLKSSLLNCFCLVLNLNSQINPRNKFETCELRGFDDFFRSFRALKSQSESCSVAFTSLQPHGVHGILQARILEWVAISFSRGSSQPRDQTKVSCTAGDSLPAEPLGKLFRVLGFF